MEKQVSPAESKSDTRHFFYLHTMRLLLLLLVLPLSYFMQAQTVTGSWYGLAEAKSKGSNANNYLTELIIKQKGNEVEGIFGYYFRSGYQSYYIRGKYNPKNRLLTIKNLPVTYYKSRDIDGVDCPMDFFATLLISKVKSTLNGSFTSHEKYKYTCPELSFSSSLDITEKNQDSLISSNTGNIKKYWKPRNEELVINTKDIGAALPVPDQVKNTASGRDSALVKTDTAAIQQAAAALQARETQRKKEIEKLVTSFEQRKNILSTVVETASDSIRISFYDNGDIDGDSISVFINKVPVLTHQPLSERSLNMYLAMDTAHPVTEITMYAENLGLYPPNTALMVIMDGPKRREVYLSSSLTQNASVIIKRKNTQGGSNTR